MGIPRFKTILLGYDGSEGSRKAVDMAAELARTYQGSIIVMCAFHQLPRVTKPTSGDFNDIHEARTLADALVQELGLLGISAETDVLEGPPAEALLNAAEVRQADLIVVGSRGFGQLKGLMLGSTSDRVVHDATIPVLVAR
jgi:nucleotide-binding universal stress UspA family protein